MNKNSNAQYFVPQVYIASLTKGKNINSVSIEDLIKTTAALEKDNEPDNEVRKLLLAYSIILIVLVWAAQVKLNSKLFVNRKANDSSPEKIFQQTESHAKMVKIISHSTAAKILFSTVSIQKAINKELFGIIDEETTEEGYLNAIRTDMYEITWKKGSGALNTNVKDPESRIAWLRANNSSLRSTWCSAPTYSPNKLASTSISIKNTKPEALLDFINKTFNALVNEGLINTNYIPNEEDIKEELEQTLIELGIVPNIDDSACGTIGAIPLDNLLGFKRNSIVNTSKPKKLPGIAESLKSKFSKKGKTTTETQALANDKNKKNLIE